MAEEAIEIYFDYRSPYAYFLWSEADQLSQRAGAPLDWHPVSIDILLNLQAGRAPWAPYEDRSDRVSVLEWRVRATRSEPRA